MTSIAKLIKESDAEYEAVKSKVYDDVDKICEDMGIKLEEI